MTVHCTQSPNMLCASYMSSTPLSSASFMVALPKRIFRIYLIVTYFWCPVPSSGVHINIHLECGGHRAGTRPLPPLYPRLSIRRIIQISNQKTRYNSLWNGNLRRNSCRNSSSFDTKCHDNLFCTKYVVQFSVQAIVFQFRNIYYKRQIYDKFFKFYPAINILRMPIFLNIEKYFHSRIYTKAMQYWLENICEVYDFGKLRVSCRLQAGSRSSEAILLLLLFNPELHEHI